MVTRHCPGPGAGGVGGGGTHAPVSGNPAFSCDGVFVGVLQEPGGAAHLEKIQHCFTICFTICWRALCPFSLRRRLECEGGVVFFVITRG